MFKRILYTSRAAEGITMRDVYDILRVAHNRNSESGLTGGLLLIDGYFLQVLEGAPYSVDERYKRIVADQRHHDVVLRLAESNSELLFPSEWMALQDGHDVDPDLLAEHAYQIGMPEKTFSGQQVLAFLTDCFARSTVE
ncbi:Blue light- and temperature-regulated antirepressor YcgF [Rubripirellula tenax]|uniref:Blue light-and temperature-regulated antirepressor YcgF n=1 Tax=Rubripirellula tenax TaxID=2528015 RepID=A0A5C6EEB5_9BACT|nr:BLUF domain-containing protein [Rubripirellula tenax]TWU46337.1 Blue light- and temperature-regulated antirepressor YcgF [Rubripirellula tenax]